MIDHKIQQELRQKFNPDGSELRKLQLCTLEILKEVHKFCEKHNIKYYLSSGTLLGAVRHGGFIPWDDDVDIEMGWWDFWKFTKYAEKEFKGNLRLQTHSTDNNYFCIFAKLRNENTYVEERTHHDKHFKFNGVFIDILYTERIIRIFTLLSRKIQKWNIKLSKKEPYWLIKPLCTIIYYFEVYIFNNILRLLNIPFLPFCSSRLALGHGFMRKRRKKEIFPLSKIKFEGYEFNCPKDSDAYLRRLYGNYNNLPDLNKLNFHVTKAIIPEHY